MSKLYFRGIGRCRHSSNFSNRQTPANTNSLNSGSGTHGSHGAAVPGGHPVKGNVCNCNMKKHNKPTAGTILVSRWPFNKLKKIFLGYKDANEMGDLLELINSSYSFFFSIYRHFSLSFFPLSPLLLLSCLFYSVFFVFMLSSFAASFYQSFSPPAFLSL